MYPQEQRLIVDMTDPVTYYCSKNDRAVVTYESSFGKFVCNDMGFCTVSTQVVQIILHGVLFCCIVLPINANK